MKRKPSIAAGLEAETGFSRLASSDGYLVYEESLEKLQGVRVNFRGSARAYC